MIDVLYPHAKIYKIEPIAEHEENEVYYGSTRKKYIMKRFYEHRKEFRKFMEGKENRCSRVRLLFEKYGINGLQIIEVKKYPCNELIELLKEEDKYIKGTPNINKLCSVPMTDEEKKIKRNEYARRYRLRKKLEKQKNE